MEFVFGTHFLFSLLSGTSTLRSFLPCILAPNRVATTLGVQDFSQLKKDYGKDQAEVIMNIVGNIISGQVVGDTAKQLSERFGKIMQERNSISINSADTSVSKSTQLDYAVPASRIASLSSGEFVGMIADDPDNKISLKVFHNEIQNDHKEINSQIVSYRPLPVIRTITQEEIQANYNQIKEDIAELVEKEITALRESIDLKNDQEETGRGMSM